MPTPVDVSSGHYMHVRHTDSEGKQSVFRYRVWNNQMALKALADNAATENAKARKEGRPALATVESIDEATYERER
ncbi:MAG TPA: hypothetical protein VFA75_07210 [Nevskia sp.]|nr:hypothetical protein [Nevskia sp.]